MTHPGPTVRDVLVVAPNFKRRLSGVTSTIVQLVPIQARTHGVAALGPGLPDSLPHLRWRDLPALWRRPQGRPFRIWHARRNVEMLPGVLMRDVLRMPLRLVFTSASQREHTGWSRFLIARMDAVIATSTRTNAYLRVPATVITHGIDQSRFRPPADRRDARRAIGLAPERRTIGCFGRIRRQKGTDLFVEAMIALLPSRPGWQAIIAGRATAEHSGFLDELKTRVAQAGLAERILFVGEHTAIHRWYQALDLFVAPQRWEGFGLTPLEALSCGVPVVAADVGVFAEIVEPSIGTIVPPGDAATLVAAAARWTDDPAGLAAASERAAVLSRERFPLEREAAAIGAVYERLWSVDPSSAKSARSAATAR